MATSAPTRIDEDLFAAAKSAGEVLSRSAAQQINHWARIGRELEASQAVSARDIAAVLAGRAPYDDLGAREQAVVRAEWDERMTELRAGLDFEAEFAAAGDTWSEADAQGRTVERGGARAAGAASPRRRRGVR
ncbi:MAG: TA system antitoxin ParD family protein [Candidatus Nanopelagicales bacterium]